MKGLAAQLESIGMSFPFFIPEFVLSAAIILLILVGLIRKTTTSSTAGVSILALMVSVSLHIFFWPLYQQPVNIFNDMLRSDGFSAYLKILIDVAGILTVIMTWRNKAQQHTSEYHALLITAILGAHLLVMSINLVMVFISLELISISSYILTGFSFSKLASEGSQKYFIFGSVASAVMLYGFTFLFGLSGTLNFTSAQFVDVIAHNPSPLMIIAIAMALAGFLYKMAAAPLHPWAPDVYEAAPMPIVAFFSVAPKLAGLAIFTRFTWPLHLFGQDHYDWQFLICMIAMLSLTVGNFSALLQQRPKRLMAYSSIAQSGFLMVGMAAFVTQGINYMLFYASVYLLVNYLVFIYLQYFERFNIISISDFAGVGKRFMWPCVFLLVGFIGLTGLPPTAGFTSKLFIFSAVWESYDVSGKPILMWLLIFGLLNTVVSLFYYLKIPFYAFVKKSESDEKSSIQSFENFLGLLLALFILTLFFMPDLLMRWINKINFVL